MIRQSIACVTRRLLAAPAVQASSSISARAFSSFTPIRPTLAARPTVFTRPSTLPFAPSASPATAAQTVDGVAADLVPRSAITAHPALSQIRCGPRNTMNGNTRLIQKRRHGYVSRMKTKDGRKIVRRRRIKGRLRLGCSN
ncbi:hypothetical protein D7B24_002933 [Verticillium nonalfalfae]|uniref:Ribosomal protein L34 n=1 Tax=Verticillium nonalfalfae TaxID=1051616 RepID=A0A3M9XXW1_9PEZI|nr:uncharacterized protein D7B24_002933 [Verticillium nonalfalfae]RNJ52755.1 hypothetical protein D7B24_002933 [Verticillium nonalfalfae]